MLKIAGKVGEFVTGPSTGIAAVQAGAKGSGGGSAVTRRMQTLTKQVMNPGVPGVGTVKTPKVSGPGAVSIPKAPSLSTALGNQAVPKMPSITPVTGGSGVAPVKKASLDPMQIHGFVDETIKIASAGTRIAMDIIEEATDQLARRPTLRAKILGRGPKEENKKHNKGEVP